MATATNFKRVLCAASEAVAFDSQLDVYFRSAVNTDDSRLDLAKLTTANVGLVGGELIADFHLSNDFFTIPEEIALDSLIVKGGAQTGPTHETIRIVAIIITRQSALNLP